MITEHEYELSPTFRVRGGGGIWSPLRCFEPVHDMARDSDEVTLDAVPVNASMWDLTYVERRIAQDRLSVDDDWLGKWARDCLRGATRLQPLPARSD